MSGRTITYEGAMNAADLRAELSKICEGHGAQAAFARKTGLRESTISSMRSGRLPINSLIANALGYIRPEIYVPARPRKAEA